MHNGIQSFLPSSHVDDASAGERNNVTADYILLTNDHMGTIGLLFSMNGGPISIASMGIKLIAM